MIKDEFNRLTKLFHEAAEGKTINLEEVFSQSLAFFEHLREQIAKGSDEERREAIAMMAEMYTRMMEDTKKICERSGMSEEQLLSFAENPSNFSPEQWQKIQESRDKIYKAGQNLARTIQDKGAGSKPQKEEQKEKSKKPKKSQWMRS
jgi:hypothetical protein